MNSLDLLDKQGETFSVKLNKGFVGLFLGRSGSGKSAAEISFAEIGPVYVFDIDNRIRGIVPARKWLGMDLFSKIDFDFYNPKDGFTSIDKKLESMVEEAEKRKLKYKTILFDSTYSLIYMLVLDSKRLRGVGADARGKIRGNLKFLQPDDYNYAYMAFREIMFNGVFPLAEYGVNVIFSGWIMDKWGKAPGSKEYDPPTILGEKMAGPAQISEELPGYFDEVYRFHKHDSAIVGGSPTYIVNFHDGIAKTCLDLPGKFMDITHKSFYKEWSQLVRKENPNVSL